MLKSLLHYLKFTLLLSTVLYINILSSEPEKEFIPGATEIHANQYNQENSNSNKEEKITAKEKKDPENLPESKRIINSGNQPIENKQVALEQQLERLLKALTEEKAANASLQQALRTAANSITKEALGKIIKEVFHETTKEHFDEIIKNLKSINEMFKKGGIDKKSKEELAAIFRNELESGKLLENKQGYFSKIPWNNDTKIISGIAAMIIVSIGCLWSYKKYCTNRDNTDNNNDKK